MVEIFIVKNEFESKIFKYSLPDGTEVELDENGDMNFSKLHGFKGDEIKIVYLSSTDPYHHGDSNVVMAELVSISFNNKSIAWKEI